MRNNPFFQIFRQDCKVFRQDLKVFRQDLKVFRQDCKTNPLVNCDLRSRLLTLGIADDRRATGASVTTLREDWAGTSTMLGAA